MTFKVRRIFPGLLDFINFFAWTSYNPSYHRDLANRRDYRTQLCAALIAFLLSIVLIVQGLQESAKRPALTFTVQNIESPNEVADLFDSEALNDGSVTSLVCPCTKSSIKLKAVSDWALVEDPFCTNLRSATTLAPPPFTPELSTLVTLAEDPQDLCIPDEARPAFFANVEQMVLQGSLFDPSSPDYNQNVQAFTFDMEKSLCSMAFGLGRQSNFVPDPINPIQSTFINQCHGVNPNEDPLLTPVVFQYSATDSNIVQIQATRTWSLFTASVEVCNTLLRLRESFSRDAGNAEFQSNVALSPTDFSLAVERVYNDILANRGGGATPFVPGFIPDITATLTGPPTLFNLQFDGIDTYNTVFSPPSNIPVQAFPLSSRIPFVRTDFIRGGARFYHIVAPASGGGVPILTGDARLVLLTDYPGRYPFNPTDEDGGGVTPGFVPGETQSWVPIGNDLLTLLDACHDGLPLSIDVHNLRPVDYQTSFTGPELWSPPYNAINISAAENARLCSMGEAPPPRTPFQTRAPQAILFSVNVSCPPIFMLLAKFRRNSTYFDATSPVRFTIDDWVAAFGRGVTSPSPPLTPVQEALFTQTIKGDSGERAALLTQNLMGVANGTKFVHDPLKYYAECKPKVCSYTIITDRTFDVIALDAVGIYGGTASAVIMVRVCVCVCLEILRH